jgi:hypothetical protein
MGWKMHGLILGRGKRFSSYLKCLDQLWGKPNSIGTGDFCPRVKWPAHKVGHLTPSGVKNEWSCIFAVCMYLHDLNREDFMPLPFLPLYFSLCGLFDPSSLRPSAQDKSIESLRWSCDRGDTLLDISGREKWQICNLNVSVHMKKFLFENNSNGILELSVSDRSDASEFSGY